VVHVPSSPALGLTAASAPQGGPDIPDTYQFIVYAMPSSYKPPKTYAGEAEDEDALSASVDGLAANAIGIGQLIGHHAD
jgi:hypothetical protein